MQKRIYCNLFYWECAIDGNNKAIQIQVKAIKSGTL